jgi:hypothetical protein
LLDNGIELLNACRNMERRSQERNIVVENINFDKEGVQEVK